MLSKKDLDRVKFKGGSVTTLPRTSAFATFSLEPIWNTHAPPQSQGSKKKKKYWPQYAFSMISVPILPIRVRISSFHPFCPGKNQLQILSVLPLSPIYTKQRLKNNKKIDYALNLRATKWHFRDSSVLYFLNSVSRCGAAICCDSLF